MADHGDGGGAVGAGGDGTGAVRGAFANEASCEAAGRGLETCSQIRGASCSPGAQRTRFWLYLPPEARQGLGKAALGRGAENMQVVRTTVGTDGETGLVGVGSLRCEKCLIICCKLCPGHGQSSLEKQNNWGLMNEE